ncbi:unnamed protein product, partial [Brenthis ino]
MDEENKLPLKRVELSLSKFNEVAIPHHLDLLRQHKTNIIKYEETGQYARMRTEQAHARRVASQLRALLGELEALRRQVRSQDVTSFDRLTQRSRDLTLRAIMDYLGVIERSCIALVRESQARAQRGDTSPVSMNRAAARDEAVAGSTRSTESVGVLALGDDQIQLQVDEQELALREREAALRGWRELQAELRALHDAWQHVQAAALAHAQHVNAVSSSTEAAAGDVRGARRHLLAAERLRVGLYGAGGAAAGALAGGPLGLVLGAKAGAAAALAGSALGYLAARLLGRHRAAVLDAQDATDTTGATDATDADGGKKER